MLTSFTFEPSASADSPLTDARHASPGSLAAAGGGWLVGVSHATGSEATARTSPLARAPLVESVQMLARFPPTDDEICLSQGAEAGLAGVMTCLRPLNGGLPESGPPFLAPTAACAGCQPGRRCSCHPAFRGLFYTFDVAMCAKFVCTMDESKVRYVNLVSSCFYSSRRVDRSMFERNG